MQKAAAATAAAVALTGMLRRWSVAEEEAEAAAVESATVDAEAVEAAAVEAAAMAAAVEVVAEDE